jgi:hypothetical protein
VEWLGQIGGSTYTVAVREQTQVPVTCQVSSAGKAPARARCEASRHRQRACRQPRCAVDAIAHTFSQARPLPGLYLSW